MSLSDSDREIRQNRRRHVQLTVCAFSCPASGYQLYPILRSLSLYRRSWRICEHYSSTGYQGVNGINPN